MPATLPVMALKPPGSWCEPQRAKAPATDDRHIDAIRGRNGVDPVQRRRDGGIPAASWAASGRWRSLGR
ncbi:MAG: hypothetical protein K2X46_09460 [Roseomonas sp.]|nr:hypothetical protein [Roseomonas sp.]